jgi:glycerol-3-phosphate acyltransferase PlsY
MMLTLLVLVASYLIGAIPFGFLVAWVVRGIDIRQHGSGNIGATNVARVLGWPFFVLVFALDCAKGAGPVAATRWLLPEVISADAPALAWDHLAILAGLSAVVGHMWPVYLRLRGGKGVATGAGVIAVLVPVPAAVAVAVWVAVVLLTRYVSAGSMAAALALCAGRLVQAWPEPLSAANWPLTAFCLLGAALVIVRHRANLVRLWRGTEPKIGRRPTEGHVKEQAH